MKLTLILLFATAIAVTGHSFPGMRDCAISVTPEDMQGCTKKMNDKVRHDGDPGNICKYLLFWVECATELYEKCGPVVERGACRGIVEAISENAPNCPNLNCDFIRG